MTKANRSDSERTAADCRIGIHAVDADRAVGPAWNNGLTAHGRTATIDELRLEPGEAC